MLKFFKRRPLYRHSSFSLKPLIWQLLRHIVRNSENALRTFIYPAELNCGFVLILKSYVVKPTSCLPFSFAYKPRHTVLLRNTAKTTTRSLEIRLPAVYTAGQATTGRANDWAASDCRPSDNRAANGRAANDWAANDCRPSDNWAAND